MIYIRIKYLSCIFWMSLLSITYSKPDPGLREKLERLLKDSEYDDMKNEIIKPRQINGMLLRDLREHDLFDSSSEEKFYTLLNRLEKNLPDDYNYSDDDKASTTTLISSTEEIISTTAIPTRDTNPKSTQAQSPSIVGSIERLSLIISRLIDFWRKSLFVNTPRQKL
ncbi:uncharacterized protein ACRADG_002310 isoform 2-T2 [Cochliomyia hominivorax]